MALSSVIRPLSSYGLYTNGQRVISRSKTGLEMIGFEMATGLKSDVSKSLGMRSATTLHMRSMYKQTEEYIAANKLMDGKMETLHVALSSIMEAAQKVSNIAIQGSTTRSAPMTVTLQAEAKVQLNAVIGYLNSTFNNEYLFSGVNSERAAMRSMNEVDPVTGRTPMQILEDIVGSDITSAADAEAKLQQIDQLFASGNGAGNPNFEGSIFNGTPLLDASGNPQPRMKLMADAATEIPYGVQANDPGLADILKGLFMLASADLNNISDDAAFVTYVNHASEALIKGNTILITTHSKVGQHHKQIADAILKQEEQRGLLNNRIVAMEGVDIYEAQARLEALRLQMEASYTATSRMQGLSFLNYMR